MTTGTGGSRGTTRGLRQKERRSDGRNEVVRYDLLFIPFYDYCNVCNRVVERGKEVKVVFAQASADESVQFAAPLSNDTR